MKLLFALFMVILAIAGIFTGSSKAEPEPIAYGGYGRGYGGYGRGGYGGFGRGGFYGYTREEILSMDVFGLWIQILAPKVCFHFL